MKRLEKCVFFCPSMACFLFYILQQITRTFLQKRHIHKQFPRCILFQHNHWHHVLSLCVFFELWMVLGETEKCRSKEKHRVFHSRVSHTQTNAVNVNNKLQRILDQNLYRGKTHTHTNRIQWCEDSKVVKT